MTEDFLDNDPLQVYRQLREDHEIDLDQFPLFHQHTSNNQSQYKKGYTFSLLGLCQTTKRMHYNLCMKVNISQTIMTLF